MIPRPNAYFGGLQQQMDGQNGMNQGRQAQPTHSAALMPQMNLYPPFMYDPRFRLMHDRRYMALSASGGMAPHPAPPPPPPPGAAMFGSLAGHTGRQSMMAGAMTPMHGYFHGNPQSSGGGTRGSDRRKSRFNQQRNYHHSSYRRGKGMKNGGAAQMSSAANGSGGSGSSGSSSGSCNNSSSGGSGGGGAGSLAGSGDFKTGGTGGSHYGSSQQSKGPSLPKFAARGSPRAASSLRNAGSGVNHSHHASSKVAGLSSAAVKDSSTSSNGSLSMMNVPGTVSSPSTCNSSGKEDSHHSTLKDSSFLPSELRSYVSPMSGASGSKSAVQNKTAAVSKDTKIVLTINPTIKAGGSSSNGSNHNKSGSLVGLFSSSSLSRKETSVGCSGMVASVETPLTADCADVKSEEASDPQNNGSMNVDCATDASMSSSRSGTEELLRLDSELVAKSSTITKLSMIEDGDSMALHSDSSSPDCCDSTTSSMVLCEAAVIPVASPPPASGVAIPAAIGAAVSAAGATSSAAAATAAAAVVGSNVLGTPISGGSGGISGSSSGTRRRESRFDRVVSSDPSATAAETRSAVVSMDVEEDEEGDDDGGRGVSKVDRLGSSIVNDNSLPSLTTSETHFTITDGMRMMDGMNPSHSQANHHHRSAPKGSPHQHARHLSRGALLDGAMAEYSHDNRTSQYHASTHRRSRSRERNSRRSHRSARNESYYHHTNHHHESSSSHHSRGGGGGGSRHDRGRYPPSSSSSSGDKYFPRRSRSRSRSRRRGRGERYAMGNASTRRHHGSGHSKRSRSRSRSRRIGRERDRYGHGGGSSSSSTIAMQQSEYSSSPRHRGGSFFTDGSASIPPPLGSASAPGLRPDSCSFNSGRDCSASSVNGNGNNSGNPISLNAHNYRRDSDRYGSMDGSQQRYQSQSASPRRRFRGDYSVGGPPGLSCSPRGSNSSVSPVRRTNGRYERDHSHHRRGGGGGSGRERDLRRGRDPYRRYPSPDKSDGNFHRRSNHRSRSPNPGRGGGRRRSHRSRSRNARYSSPPNHSGLMSSKGGIHGVRGNMDSSSPHSHGHHHSGHAHGMRAGMMLDAISDHHRRKDLDCAGSKSLKNQSHRHSHHSSSSEKRKNSATPPVSRWVGSTRLRSSFDSVVNSIVDRIKDRKRKLKDMQSDWVSKAESVNDELFRPPGVGYGGIAGEEAVINVDGSMMIPSEDSQQPGCKKRRVKLTKSQTNEGFVNGTLEAQVMADLTQYEKYKTKYRNVEMVKSIRKLAKKNGKRSMRWKNATVKIGTHASAAFVGQPHERMNLLAALDGFESIMDELWKNPMLAQQSADETKFNVKTEIYFQWFQFEYLLSETSRILPRIHQRLFKVLKSCSDFYKEHQSIQFLDRRKVSRMIGKAYLKRDCLAKVMPDEHWPSYDWSPFHPPSKLKSFNLPPSSDTIRAVMIHNTASMVTDPSSDHKTEDSTEPDQLIISVSPDPAMSSSSANDLSYFPEGSLADMDEEGSVSPSAVINEGAGAGDSASVPPSDPPSSSAILPDLTAQSSPASMSMIVEVNQPDSLESSLSALLPSSVPLPGPSLLSHPQSSSSISVTVLHSGSSSIPPPQPAADPAQSTQQRSTTLPYSSSSVLRKKKAAPLDHHSHHHNPPPNRIHPTLKQSEMPVLLDTDPFDLVRGLQDLRHPDLSYLINKYVDPNDAEAMAIVARGISEKPMRDDQSDEDDSSRNHGSNKHHHSQRAVSPAVYIKREKRSKVTAELLKYHRKQRRRKRKGTFPGRAFPQCMPPPPPSIGTSGSSSRYRDYHDSLDDDDRQDFEHMYRHSKSFRMMATTRDSDGRRLLYESVAKKCVNFNWNERCFSKRCCKEHVCTGCGGTHAARMCDEICPVFNWSKCEKLCPSKKRHCCLNCGSKSHPAWNCRMLVPQVKALYYTVHKNKKVKLGCFAQSAQDKAQRKFNEQLKRFDHHHSSHLAGSSFRSLKRKIVAKGALSSKVTYSAIKRRQLRELEKKEAEERARKKREDHTQQCSIRNGESSMQSNQKSEGITDDRRVERKPGKNGDSPERDGVMESDEEGEAEEGGANRESSTNSSDSGSDSDGGSDDSSAEDSAISDDCSGNGRSTRMRNSNNDGRSSLIAEPPPPKLIVDINHSLQKAEDEFSAISDD